MELSSYTKDKFVAPEMSKLTAATIRDMSRVDSQQEHWLSNFILNTILRAEVPSPERQQIYNFLRRSHAAFAEYALAREATHAYVSGTEWSPLRYLEAIGHWEAFLAYAWQAHGFIGGGKKDWFKKGDGSVRERLNELHNRAKHADEAIVAGKFIEDSPLCVWLTNNGLRSIETSLTFDEIAAILDDFAQWANALQDPAAIHEV